MTEAEKYFAPRPTGVSRRGFLKALGVTAVTVAGGSVLTWDHFDKILVAPPGITPDRIADLVSATLEDLGRPSFVDIASRLQEHTAMSDLLNTHTVVIDSGSKIQFNYKVPADYKPRRMFCLSQG